MHLSPPNFDAVLQATASRPAIHAESGSSTDPVSALDIVNLRDLFSNDSSDGVWSDMRARRSHRWTRVSSGAAAISRPHESWTDTAATIEYWASDDLPGLIHGLSAPYVRVARSGYWTKALGSQAFTPLVASAKVAEIMTHLSELSEGWNGPGTQAPGAAVQGDIIRALANWPAGIREPSIEVDDEGGVALVWDGDESSFALTFLGNGNVVGTLSPFTEGHEPWVSAVDDAPGIFARLSSQNVAQLTA